MWTRIFFWGEVGGSRIRLKAYLIQIPTFPSAVEEDLVSVTIQNGVNSISFLRKKVMHIFYQKIQMLGILSI